MREFSNRDEAHASNNALIERIKQGAADLGVRAAVVTFGSVVGESVAIVGCDCAGYDDQSGPSRSEAVQLIGLLLGSLIGAEEDRLRDLAWTSVNAGRNMSHELFDRDGVHDAPGQSTQEVEP